jgi:hypothetical protein
MFGSNLNASLLLGEEDTLIHKLVEKETIQKYTK